VEKNIAFAAVIPLLKQFETKALRKAAAVVPVCAALEKVARDAGAVNIHRIEDVSLLDEDLLPSLPLDREPPPSDKPVFMYVGNLEVYQGIDLFLQAASQLHQREIKFHCVVVGGRPEAIKRYTLLAEKLEIGSQVDFWGPKPLAMMKSLFQVADILVSPRLKGVNTPMKLYSYLDSGNPVLATNLPTHTQVVTADHVMLADPEPEPFAQAMKRLALDPALRARLAARGKTYVEKEFNLRSYQRKVKQLYESLQPAEPAK
jgi:glycosyltransferase involved in cell wall biosynthesis